jgi:hypothetical protein
MRVLAPFGRPGQGYETRLGSREEQENPPAIDLFKPARQVLGKEMRSKSNRGMAFFAAHIPVSELLPMR